MDPCLTKTEDRNFDFKLIKLTFPGWLQYHYDDLQSNQCGWLPLTLQHFFIVLHLVPYLHITLSAHKSSMLWFSNLHDRCPTIKLSDLDARKSLCMGTAFQNLHVKIAIYMHITCNWTFILLTLAGRQYKMYSGTCHKWLEDEQSLRFAVFSDLMPCSLEGCQHFSGTACLHHHSRWWRHADYTASYHRR